MTDVPESGKNEAAKDQFLAKGRHQGDHHQQLPDICITQHLLHALQGVLSALADRIQLRDRRLQHIDRRMQEHCQQQRDGKIFDSILDAWVFWDGRVQSVNEGASIDSVDREAAG